MQAHPLSTPAASISSLIATPSLPPSLPWIASIQPPVRLLPEDLSPPPPTVGMLAVAIAEDAGLAHDAGNLLGALHLYTDLLRAPGVLGPEHRHYATELGLIAARSTALIRRLLPPGPLAAAQPVAAAPRQAPVLRAADAATALQTLAPLLRRIAEGAATVRVTAPSTLPLVDLPAEALERIAVNLVCNAAEAIRSSRRDDTAAATMYSSGPLQHQDAGHIRVSLEVFGGALRLTVEDNGPGMPPAVAAAFLRPGSMPVNAGRGLGHRIVHELTQATGGKLSIRVRPGRGSAICVRWPLAGGDGGSSPC